VVNFGYESGFVELGAIEGDTETGPRLARTIVRTTSASASTGMSTV